MAETVETADGKPVGVDPAVAADADKQFAQAMSASQPGDADAPPRRQPRARAEASATPRTRQARRSRITAAEGKGSAPASPAAPSRNDIITGVAGLIQIPAGLALLASQRAANPVPLKADAITLASHAPALAAAAADVAEQDEKAARLLARICDVGPYAALMTALFNVGAQLARNHGIASLPGTSDPEALVAAAEAPPATTPTEGDPDGTQ